jgi:hypothetical protein
MSYERATPNKKSSEGKRVREEKSRNGEIPQNANQPIESAAGLAHNPLTTC